MGVMEQRSRCTWLGWSKDPGKVGESRDVRLGLCLREGARLHCGTSSESHSPCYEGNADLRRLCRPLVTILLSGMDEGLVEFIFLFFAK